MKTMGRYFGAFVLSASFVGLGLAIYTGNRLTEHTMTYGGIDPINVQDMIIDKLGEQTTGAIFVVIGIVAGFWSVLYGIKKSD